MARPMINCNTGKRDRWVLSDYHEQFVGPTVCFSNATRSEHDMPKTEERFIYELCSHRNNTLCSSKLSLMKTCTHVRCVPDIVEDITPHSPFPQYGLTSHHFQRHSVCTCADITRYQRKRREFAKKKKVHCMNVESTKQLQWLNYEWNGFGMKRIMA
jgi:hypothetical protein